MATVVSAGRLVELAGPNFYGGPWHGYNIDWLPPEAVTPEAVWATQPSVRKVVDFIARAVASTPIKIYERVSDTDRQRLAGHPIDRVLRLPSQGVTPFRFWHSVIVDWLIFDRWLAIKAVSDDPARPIDLLRMQAQRLQFLDDGFGRVARVRVDGGRQELNDPGQWLLDHGYAPLGANGITPMATLQGVLAESSEAVDYRRAVWRNGARITSVIQRPADAPPWSPDARQRFADGWRDYAQGGSRAGGSPILEDGMTIAKVDAFTPEQTQDLQGRQLNEIEVCSAYHIPPELLGARQGNYATVSAYAEMLYGPTLGPVFAALEQVVNAMLVAPLDEGGDLYAEFDVSVKLRGTFEHQAAVLSSAVGAPWMTRGEARARVNLPELADTDELVTPLNVLIGGQASPRDTGSQNTEIGRAQPAMAAFGQFLIRQRRVVLGSGVFDEGRWRRELEQDLSPHIGDRAAVVAQVITDSLHADLDEAGPRDAGGVFDRWQRHALEGA